MPQRTALWCCGPAAVVRTRTRPATTNNPDRETNMNHARLVTAAIISLATAAAICPRQLSAQDGPSALPTPTGNMSVATTVVHMVDSTRSARGDASGSGKRELVVQLWYPRTPTKDITVAPYIPDPRVLDAL